MGWNTANEIFDPVAEVVIELDTTSYDEKVKILSKLIHQLQEGDWDTEDESLEQFKDVPAVVEAFRQNEIHLTHCPECGNRLDCGW